MKFPMKTGKCAIVSEFDCFLNAIPPEAQAQLRRFTVDHGQPICRAGDSIQTIFLLCDGHAHVSAPSGEMDGGYRTSGSMLGVEEVLKGCIKWPALIQAVTPCEVIALDAEVFLGSLNNPHAVMALLEQTLRQGRAVQQQFIGAMTR